MIILTHHATRQAQRRGVTHRSVELAVEFGARARTRDGCFVRILTERAAQQAQRLQPLGVHEVQRALGTTVITEEIDTLKTVITVLSKHKAIGPGRYHKRRRYAAHA